MARKRMIDPTIWADESFGKMSPEAQVMFIGIISNSDDEGRLPGDAAFLSSIIFPYKSLSLHKSQAILQEILLKMTSVLQFSVKNKKYIQLLKWKFYQKVDRPTPSKYPIFDEDSSKTQETVPPNRIEENRIEEKRRENTSSSMNYLREIPQEDLREFSDMYVITWKEIIGKAKSLINYCEMHGKKYENYKALLRNAISRDYQAREEKIGLSASELVEAHKGQKI
ncbi:MAG: hypothetical protein AABY22_27205 [Nanoarchaeota archaeon]